MGAPRLIGLAAVTLVTGIVAACGDGYGEDSPSPTADAGADSGSPPNVADSADDAVAPSLNCPLGCLPPAPAGWTGPSAVYEGTSAGKPTTCPPLYTQKEREGQDGVTAGTASCACGSGVAQGTKCTVTVSSYPAAKCGGTPVKVTPDPAVTKCVDRAAASSSVEVETALTPGTCAFPNAKLSAVAPTFARTAVACGLPQYASCSERPDCVASPIPDAPFTRLCIHKSGEQPCPSVDYAARFVSFASVKDARACSCAGTPEASCGSAANFYTAAGCQGAVSVGGAGVCSTGISVDISALTPVTKGCDAGKVQSSVTGAVSLSDPVTFCCNK